MAGTTLLRTARRTLMRGWCWCSLVLVLFACRLEAQSPTPPRGPIDSVVLIRTPVPGWPCAKCPPPRVTIRRDGANPTALTALERKADSLGFYALPADVMGASFCPVVRSDDLMAMLSIYHPDGHWSVRGYHHCTNASSEKNGLLSLEALVDSLAAVPAHRPF